MTILFSSMRNFILLQGMHLNRFRNSAWHFITRHRVLSPLFLVLFGLFFWGYFIITHKLVRYVFFQDYFGIILATKLVQLQMLVCIGLSFVSGLTPAISSLYLSKDLEFQFALPIQLPVQLLDRFISILLQSSGMILLFGSPFLYHYISFSEKGLLIFFLSFLAMAMTCAVPILITMMASMLLVRVFPVQRLQQVFLVVSVVLLASLVLFFRYLEPEQFVGPGGMERFKGYMDLVQIDRMAWNPGIWSGNMITALGQSEWTDAWRYFGYLAATNLGLFLLLFVWGSGIYRKSWDRALHALSGDSKPSRRRSSPLSRTISHPKWNQEIKEILLFFRDPSQWAQLFVLAAIVVLCLFSIHKLSEALPVNTPLMLAILNSGFISFVALSISSRFVFTSFSMDGQALWILRTIPDGWRRYVRSKFLVYGFPVFFFSMLLQLGTVKVLDLTAFGGLYLAMATFWDCAFIVALSTLFGMLFMNPTIDNPLKMIISPGGILLMGSGLFFCLLHMVVRFSGQSKMFNYYSSKIGFPDLQGGRELPWSIALLIVEISLLFYFNYRAMKKLQTLSD